MADKRKTFLWIFGLIVLSSAMAVLQFAVNFDGYYDNGYEAGKKAGLNIGYYIGEEDGAKAGGKQGTAAGELLLQFVDVAFDSEAHEIPKAEIEVSDSKKIFVSAGIMALIPSYAEGYREGYDSGFKKNAVRCKFPPIGGYHPDEFFCAAGRRKEEDQNGE